MTLMLLMLEVGLFGFWVVEAESGLAVICCELMFTVTTEVLQLDEQSAEAQVL